MPCIRKRNEFMFLSSVFVPSPLSPLRRTDTLASARSEPSSMFTSLTPSWRSVTRRRLSQSRASSVVIDDARLRAVDAARFAEVDELGGVLLEVDPVQPHVAQVAAAAQGRVVLGDLVVL